METPCDLGPPASSSSPASSMSAYKQSARAHSRTRAPRRGVGFASETFRSPRVLKEVAQSEKKFHTASHQHEPFLAPEEAFDKLQQTVLALPRSGKSGGIDATEAQEMMDGLEAACWQRFAAETSDNDSDLHASGHPEHGRNHERASSRPRVLYSQLLRGTEGRLGEQQAASQTLRDEIELVVERNNELPHLIKECQAAVARAVDSATHGGAAGDRSINQTVSSDGGVDERMATMRKEMALLRRRKELRIWACNELRVGLNDHLTRRSELKNQISAVASDVKKEEQANKQRAKRLENLRTSPASSPSVPYMNSRIGLSSVQQQLTLVLARNAALQETRRERKAYIRARTEAIFDVRNQVRELNDQRAVVDEELQDLEEEATHVKRSCTPRPDWGELQNATVVTTAVDRAASTARMRLGANRSKLKGEGSRDEADEELRLAKILSSNWSTVAKVSAMATELTRIRLRDHAGDIITVEQKKLQHLQKEIARTLQQLEAVKAQMTTT
ncbi:hypothetical protein BBJ28_00024524 [Nothophytophthora sp. Chile5]|nr:hypothetical protein BBJ28_00024524 [Nothophytophthora sp. Chile5]